MVPVKLGDLSDEQRLLDEHARRIMDGQAVPFTSSPVWLPGNGLWS